MTNTEALAEAVLYLAGAIEKGQVDAAQITGGMLRRLVEIAQRAPAEVSIGSIWDAAHDAIGPAWRDKSGIVAEQ